MDNELLVLGLLKLQEMHGYQLGELIDKRLKYITDLKKPTLYHLLGRLESGGDIVKSASREGNRPERFTYRLTEQGEEHFQSLLRENLQDTHAMYFDDDIGLIFLSELSASQARAFLEQKRASVDEHLAEMRAGLARHEPGTPPYYALRHHFLHLRTERAWLDELLGELQERAVRSDVLQCLDAVDAAAVKSARTKNK